MTKEAIRQIIGDPKKLDTELQEFRRNAMVISSKRAHIIGKYPKRWIAIYDGKVKADEGTLDQLLARVDELQMPREHIVVRYIDKNSRKMIL